MADTHIRVEQYDPNGNLINTIFVEKELEVYNKDVIEERALTALTNNLSYLALEPPTQAQAVAQVDDLTRQINGVIRLLLNKLDSAD